MNLNKIEVSVKNLVYREYFFLFRNLCYKNVVVVVNSTTDERKVRLVTMTLENGLNDFSNLTVEQSNKFHFSLSID